jgi:hypothetical protein
MNRISHNHHGSRWQGFPQFQYLFFRDNEQYEVVAFTGIPKSPISRAESIPLNWQAGFTPNGY